MIINIRGTNGSGKTTLARQLLGPDPLPVDLIPYEAPTKKDPNRVLHVEGYGKPGEFLAIGSYKQGCGGMDTVPSFDLQQRAVLKAARWQDQYGVGLAGEAPKHVICEGVLASTVAGSWLEFFKTADLGGHEVLVAYLDTPLEVCLERIKARQKASGRAEREIKTDLVADKIKAINATRAKFEAAGIRTVSLGWEAPYDDLREAIHV